MKRQDILWLPFCAALVTSAGCGPVRLIANTNIPTPLIVRLPVGVALFMPKEFSQYVHKEERWSTDWEVALGKAQSNGMNRLFAAMFERVVPVESINAGVEVPNIRAILEPSIEEFAFVTPRDAGSPFFAVSIKYRVNVYSPDGKLADSWGFTGYGASPAQGLSSTEPLAAATALALRDAGAKLAVEFRDQAIVRNLLPEAEASADAPPPAPSEAPTAPPSDGAQSSGAAAPAPTEEAQQEAEEDKQENEEKKKDKEAKPPVEALASAPRDG